MKILVTGATGFLGNHVINDLLKKGAEVIATSRNELTARKCNWFGNVKFIPFEIKDAIRIDGNLYDLFGRPDKLIHLAWENLPNYNELHHFEENLLPAYYFLKRMIVEGLKDVTVTGTCLEYGMQTGCLNESMKTDPRNPYSISKDSLRRMMEVLHDKYDFKFKWIRLFYMYGAGQSEKSLYPQMEKAILENQEEFRMSAGEQMRDFLSVEEVSALIIKIALSGTDAGVVNCCSGTPQKVKSFVENYFASRKRNVKLILGHYPYPDYEPFEFWGDTKKLKSIQ